MKNQPETELFKQFDGNKTYTGVINHLAGYTDYEFRLLAYTKVGGRFKSSPVTVKTHRGGKRQSAVVLSHVIRCKYYLPTLHLLKKKFNNFVIGFLFIPWRFSNLLPFCCSAQISKRFFSKQT